REMLRDGKTMVLGRDPECDFVVDWDVAVSRQHLEILADGTTAKVTRVSQSSNPVFVNGKEVDSFHLTAEDSFVIGSTSFRLVRGGDTSSAGTPVEQVSFDQQELQRFRYRDAEKRIDVLTNLPELIRGARLRSELHVRLANLILAGVHSADAVAIVSLDDSREVDVKHWERRVETGGQFRPSTRLILEAIRSGRSVLHIWESASEMLNDYTQTAGFDWSFCTPVPDDTEPWALYVAGRHDRTSEAIDDTAENPNAVFLQGDVKFTEFIAQIISSVEKQTRLERQQAGLRQFFAPRILEALGSDLDTDQLEPRECDVTVLFCDLRGFSQKAEENADQLIPLLNRVSRALELMTTEILNFGGVTGDFQGDAALGFWGWPFESEDAALEACQAALGIRQAFDRISRQTNDPLQDFRVGIGVAHGRAVAGKIGTSDQVKVTVFGPVVNLASRLEGMTKQLRVPILLDEKTSAIVRPKLSSKVGRIRKLLRVMPYGMETPLTVSELLPPASEYPELNDEHIKQFERGVDSFITGDWETAWSCLHSMPAGDRAQDYLSMQITRQNRTAPPDWDGVVKMLEK
ncbi:MAG: adenylate/guanylate cyclase domain-containing protein, partial [Planctomycetaceae bacterium]